MTFFSRYKVDDQIMGGTMLGTAQSTSLLRRAVNSGIVPVVRRFRTTGFDRLDNLAGAVYDDSNFWWVLAATSDIGWGLQVPPNTIIVVVSIDDVRKVVG
jgi:hypothetical protein